MKRHIRGVGSGLPIVKECLGFAGGSVEIDDNLGRGTVVTLRVEPPAPSSVPEDLDAPAAVLPRLTDRQKQVFSLVMELGSVGPSAVVRELGVGLATAYRDLGVLETRRARRDRQVGQAHVD